MSYSARQVGQAACCWFQGCRQVEQHGMPLATSLKASRMQFVLIGMQNRVVGSYFAATSKVLIPSGNKDLPRPAGVCIYYDLGLYSSPKT
jgi:hypothetical protein